MSDAEHPWLDEFFQEPVVQRITEALDYYGGDLVLQAFEICHGVQAFAHDYNSSDSKIQELWALLHKYEYRDYSSANWDENPYGEEVYEFLEKTLA